PRRLSRRRASARNGWATPRPAPARSTRPERAKRSPASSTHYLSSLPFSAFARGDQQRRRRVSRPSALSGAQPPAPAPPTTDSAREGRRPRGPRAGANAYDRPQRQPRERPTATNPTRSGSAG